MSPMQTRVRFAGSLMGQEDMTIEFNSALLIVVTLTGMAIKIAADYDPLETTGLDPNPGIRQRIRRIPSR